MVGLVCLVVYLSLRSQWSNNGWTPFRGSWLSGGAQVLTSIGFLGAVAYIDVSLAALIFYFHPFVVALIGHYHGDSRLTPLLISYIAVAIAGLALVFGVSFESLNFIGISLSLIGMAAVTVMILTVSRSSKDIGPVSANLNMTVWGVIYLLVIILIGPRLGFDIPLIYPESSIGWIAVLGAGITTTLGFVLFFTGATMIGTTRAVVLGMSEPLLAILLAIMLVNEWLTGIQWVGVCLVLGSLVLFEVGEKRK